MHKTKRRHSAERRTTSINAAGIAQRAIALAHKGDLKTAARTALLAERLQRLEAKLRPAKKASSHARATAAIADAERAVASLSRVDKPQAPPLPEYTPDLRNFPNIRRALERGE